MRRFFLACLLLSALTLPAAAFSDVPAGHWAAGPRRRRRRGRTVRRELPCRLSTSVR